VPLVEGGYFEISAYMADKQADNVASYNTSHPSSKPPRYVYPVPHLADDISALMALTNSFSPTERKVRPDATAVAIYGFADPSGQGFGSTLVINYHVHFRHGQWVPHWHLRGTKLLESAEYNLRSLSKTTPLWVRSLLRQLFFSGGGGGPVASKHGVVHVTRGLDFLSSLWLNPWMKMDTSH
jgi:hypothetical protein